jgi:hypothetical protein
MERKHFISWASVFVLVVVASLYWREIATAYRAAYPNNPLRTHALVECARMNPQFNRFWMSDRTMCYEGHGLAQ